MIKNLKKLRQSFGISQQQLADQIMVSQQSVNKYENHEVEPSIATLIKIADYFDVSTDYLIGRTSVKTQADNPKSTDLNESETKLIKRFRKLNDKQKKLIEFIVENL